MCMHLNPHCKISGYANYACMSQVYRDDSSGNEGRLRQAGVHSLFIRTASHNARYS